MTRLFGTDGVRGVANAELTPELAFRLGEAAGHFLGDRGRGRIVVGRDTRRSGDMLEAALVAGICSGGADALLRGIVPTPAVALLTRELEADGGVVISASHNPPEYNGIKFFSRDGFKLPDELEDEIEEFMVAERAGSARRARASGGRTASRTPRERYIAHAVATVDGDLRGCASRSTAATAPRRVARRRRSSGSAPRSSRSTATGTAWTSTSGCGSTHLDADRRRRARRRLRPRHRPRRRRRPRPGRGRDRRGGRRRRDHGHLRRRHEGARHARQTTRSWPR